MLAPLQKSKWPGGAGQFAEQIRNENLDSAMRAENWEYRVREVLGRFLVISPLGIAIEDCRTETAAIHVAAVRNGRAAEVLA